MNIVAAVAFGLAIASFGLAGFGRQIKGIDLTNLGYALTVAGAVLLIGVR